MDLIRRLRRSVALPGGGNAEVTIRRRRLRVKQKRPSVLTPRDSGLKSALAGLNSWRLQLRAGPLIPSRFSREGRRETCWRRPVCEIEVSKLALRRVRKKIAIFPASQIGNKSQLLPQTGLRRHLMFPKGDARKIKVLRSIALDSFGERPRFSLPARCESAASLRCGLSSGDAIDATSLLADVAGFHIF